MKWVGRAVAAVSLMLLPAACGRSCGCASGETIYETLDGKVKVELVRDVHWTSGKIPGPITKFALRVHTTPPISHPIACSHVDLAENDAGTLVAWRCLGESPWNLLRLRGGDRSIVECEAPVGTARKPEWDKVESLSRSADRVLACALPAGLWALSVWTKLTQAMEEDEGPDATAAFYVRSAEQPHAAKGEDPWGLSLARGSVAVRDRVLRTVCGALSRDDASMPLYVRAAEQCPLDAPGVGQAAAAQLRRLLVRPMGKRLPNGEAAPDALGTSHRLATEWAAVLGAANAPAAAGQASCDVASSIPASDEGVELVVSPRRIALALITLSTTRCDAIAPWLSPPPCAASLDCDGGLCDAKELADDVKQWASLPHATPDGGDPRERPRMPPAKVRSLLAAAYARGPLDRETALRNARRSYAWPDGGPALACETADASDGTPCRCSDRSMTHLFCSTEVATTHLRHGACSFHVDDANKRIDDVKRACAAEGASCAAGRVCCGALLCRTKVGETGQFCRPPYVPDAGGAGAPVE